MTKKYNDLVRYIYILIGLGYITLMYTMFPNCIVAWVILFVILLSTLIYTNSNILYNASFN